MDGMGNIDSDKGAKTKKVSVVSHFERVGGKITGCIKGPSKGGQVGESAQSPLN